MNNKATPSYDGNEYTCPKCSKFTKHSDINFWISKNQERTNNDGKHIGAPINYYYEIQATEKDFVTSIAKNIDNYVWKNIFPNDKLKFFENCEWKNKKETSIRSVIAIKIKVCTNCGNRLIWEGDTSDYNVKLSNQNLTNFDIDEPSEYLPEKLKDIYEEARSISLLSPISSLALLRYILEQMLIDKGYGKNSNKLYDMLSSEKLKKDIGNNLAKIGDNLRFIANKAIHPSEIDMDAVEDKIDKVFNWINRITDALYNTYDSDVSESNDLKEKATSKKT